MQKPSLAFGLFVVVTFCFFACLPALRQTATESSSSFSLYVYRIQRNFGSENSLLSSFMVLYVHRNYMAYSRDGERKGQGMRAQAHLPFHTAPELCPEIAVC